MMNRLKEYYGEAGAILGLVGIVMMVLYMLFVNLKFNDIERRIVRMETVMIMKNIMPSEFVYQHKDDK